MNKKLLHCFLLIIPVVYGSACCQASHITNIEEQRHLFLQTERLLDKKQDIEARGNFILLHDYPLLPYLEYRLLRRNLHLDDEIRVFLINHQTTRYAPLLRRQWLLDLAKRKQWRLFLQNYHATSNVSLQCLHQLALYHSGKQRQALQAALKLWSVGHSQPDVCNPLFDRLKYSGLLTDVEIWRRFDLALQKGNTGLAGYIMRSLDAKGRKTAAFWLKVHNDPSLIETDYWFRFYSHQGQIFSHGIERMARNDPLRAISFWDVFKNRYEIPAQRKRRVEKKLALALVYNREAGAYKRLAALPDDNAKVRVWRVRAALREQNWPHVLAALDRLSETEQRQIQWMYWRARALDRTGQKQQARSVFARVAEDRSFYGFLAAQYNGLPFAFADKPIQLGSDDLTDLLSRPDFVMANEFRILERQNQAWQQWWYAVKHLNTEELKTAAKLADLWQWHHIAVFTVAKAKYWDDLQLRFPVLFSEPVQKNARRHNLDPAMIFALIRQESVFNPKAQSPVGALGLMQIMPKTAKQIARDLHERWHSAASLFEPVVNIKYGSYYYKQLLNRFNGYYALAVAAYNAGPRRVEHWLPETGVLPMDIWIETIPFNETRRYVRRVLAYALIYQQRVGGDSLSLRDFVIPVYPEKSI